MSYSIRAHFGNLKLDLSTRVLHTCRKAGAVSLGYRTIVEVTYPTKNVENPDYIYCDTIARRIRGVSILPIPFLSTLPRFLLRNFREEMGRCSKHLCTKPATYSVEGAKTVAYCKQHAASRYDLGTEKTLLKVFMYEDGAVPC